jgi:hypothetical protein
MRDAHSGGRVKVMTGRETNLTSQIKGKNIVFPCIE